MLEESHRELQDTRPETGGGPGGRTGLETRSRFDWTKRVPELSRLEVGTTREPGRTTRGDQRRGMGPPEVSLRWRR